MQLFKSPKSRKSKIRSCKGLPKVGNDLLRLYVITGDEDSWWPALDESSSSQPISFSGVTQVARMADVRSSTGRLPCRSFSSLIAKFLVQQ
ncbi:hypothetical protein PanWU01x14_229700 [Parasponia andersonii]|uniref:Uncharacterized protein n=1 Tax=Parasponia andersonii TaxID=3476 RepID=A0A2P5BL94_PARAD|nr:hypothetical protein PanWU01x14_229700 [Parasponia andersonii]